MRGHRVEVANKTRVYKTPIHETPLLRIRRNIAKLSPKILAVANPMLMESHLPNFAMELRPHLMRESALDALCAPLNRLVRRRSKQNVQMLRHHNEAMQLVASLIPVVEKRLDQQLGIYRSNKE